MSRSSKTLHLVLVLCLMLCASVPAAHAGGKAVTWYLDGAIVEQELVIDNYRAELLIPATMKSGSLRVRPFPGTRITRVELEPVKPGRLEEKELARLEERSDELRDRLKALAVKEEIFKATAKSQGSKAPRRTRTNPEPISSLRQGTDYAISRLEEVYRATRNAERELKELQRKRETVSKNTRVSGSVAKLRLEGKRGRVQVSYVKAGEGWTPFYDIRVAGGVADVTLMARLPEPDKGGATFAVSSYLSDDSHPAPVKLDAAEAKVASYRMPVVSERSMQSLQKSAVVTLKNDTGISFPPGESSCFLQEEFIGYTRFGGLKPMESIDLVFGGSPEALPDVKKSE